MTSYEIELDTFEIVVRGGVRRVTWRVADGDDWLSAPDFPGAAVENRDRAPGMVWLRRVIIRLPVGARLMRVESAPERALAKDPLAYLWGAPRSREWRVKRSYFIVSDHGQLTRSETAG